MAKTDAAAAAAAFRAAHPDIATVDPLIVDMVGAMRGKRLAIDGVEKVIGGGVVLPGSTYVMDILGNNVEATGLGPPDGDPDYPIHLVPGTLAPVPRISRVPLGLLRGIDRVRDILFDNTRRFADGLGLPLPVLALRAALDHPLVHHVLIGADHPDQFAVVEAALAAGADDYLQKPADLKALRQAVATLIEESKRRASAPKVVSDARRWI